MKTNNPAPGNGPGLFQYLEDLSYKATRLAGLTHATAFLESEERCNEGKASLIFLAEELAAELNTSLDSVNLPKGDSA